MHGYLIAICWKYLALIVFWSLESAYKNLGLVLKEYTPVCGAHVDVCQSHKHAWEDFMWIRG